MLDLISTTEELHYENYRQAQMEVRKFGEQKPRKFENPKFKEEEEALRKRFTEQVKAEEARFRQWEQHVRTMEWRLSDMTDLAIIAHPRTRSPQQGPRNGAQCNQSAGSRAGQLASRLRTWYWQTVKGSLRVLYLPRNFTARYLLSNSRIPDLPDRSSGRFRCVLRCRSFLSLTLTVSISDNKHVHVLCTPLLVYVCVGIRSENVVFM